MKKLLVVTLAIQSIGVLANFVLTFAVATLAGPEVQGLFATYKSWYDFQIVLLIFGLPGGLVYFINKSQGMTRSVYTMSWKYAVALFPVLIIANILILPFLIDSSASTSVYSASIYLAAAAAMMIAYGLFRAVYLTEDDGYKFSLISIFPQVMLLMGIVYAVSSNHISIPMAYLIAAIASIVVTWRMCCKILPKNHPKPDQKLERKDWGVLKEQSGNVYIQSLMYGAQPMITFYLMRQFGANTADIGFFSISALVITGPNLLVAMVAPVLLNRWSKELTSEKLFPIIRNILVSSVVVQALGLLLWPMLKPLVPVVFGESFSESVPSMTILLFSALAVLSTRAMTPAFQGIGKNNWVTYSCTARFLIILTSLCTFANMPLSFNILDSAAWSWVLGEYAALIILLTGARAKQTAA